MIRGELTERANEQSQSLPDTQNAFRVSRSNKGHSKLAYLHSKAIC